MSNDVLDAARRLREAREEARLAESKLNELSEMMIAVRKRHHDALIAEERTEKALLDAVT